MPQVSTSQARWQRRVTTGHQCWTFIWFTANWYFNRILEQITGYLFIRFFPFAYERINPNLLPGYLFGFQSATIKETVRGGRVAEMSAHSIQRCDWPTWRSRARTANHSAESSGPTFRLLFLLSRSPWPLSSILYPGNISIGLTAISRLIQIHNRTKFRPCVHLVCLFIWNSPLNLICFLNRFCKSQFGYWIS